MIDEKAMSLIPTYAQTKIPHREEATETMFARLMNHAAERIRVSFRRKWGILIIGAALFTIYTILLSAGVEHRTEARVRQEMAGEYASQLEAYKAEQARAVQAEHWLSGDASREAFINQEIDAAAHFIAEEANETMKGTKLGVAIARLMAGGYGSTLREVINQPDQWMFYSGEDNKFTQADREFAEGIVRRYYEDNIIPNDLTTDIQWMMWSPGDYQAMNNWNASAATRKWRYHG